MRLQFEFSNDRINELKQLKEETGSETLKELFNNALTMLEWAIEEVKAGNEIAAVNEDEKVYRVFITPLLERVAKQHKRQMAGAGARG
jgi:hypothetical protein